MNIDCSYTQEINEEEPLFSSADDPFLLHLVYWFHDSQIKQQTKSQAASKANGAARVCEFLVSLVPCTNDAVLNMDLKRDKETTA